MERDTAPHAGDGKARGAVFSKDPAGVSLLNMAKRRTGVEKSNERGKGAFSPLASLLGRHFLLPVPPGP